MNGNLERVENWHALAVASRFRVAALARAAGVSRRTLERYFLEQFHTRPQVWLELFRDKQAMEYLLWSRLAPKEIAGELGYSPVSAFSRAFKRPHRAAPTGVILLSLARH